MKKVLILGAGRSSSSLINYMNKNAQIQDWQVRVGDFNGDLAVQKCAGYERSEGFFFNVKDEKQRQSEISNADIVISMLPANMHFDVAKECVLHKKNMVTASYISDEMKSLSSEAQNAGVIMMNEIGVDPGIDHMSAMKILDEIQGKNQLLHSFESFTGGLIAPESDNNPWNYKFTWNPRNVVLAGAGSAVKFRQEGKYKYIPYHRLFRRSEIINIEGYGRFEGYANRDSLKYIDVYGLQDIPTIYRGTLRRPGFCRAWNVFVQLGATDDSYVMEGSEDMTYRDFINSFLLYNPHDSVELKLMHYLQIDHDSVVLDKLKWLDIFSDKKVGLKNATPAQILQKILEDKWTLEPDDKDMIVMWHKFNYFDKDKLIQKESSMVCIGEDQINTAMAKTVGVPVAIAAKMILNGVITTPGVHRPVNKEVYEPVLTELEEYGISFHEKEFEINKESL